MALTDKLSAIGDAIRMKTGKSGKLTLGQMVSEIGSIPMQTISSDDIPNYVRDEVREIINKVSAVQNANTITFVSISDPHHMASQTGTWQINTNNGNLHAFMGVKALCHVLNFDFAYFGGDYVFGNSETTESQLKEQIGIIKNWANEAFAGCKKLYTLGNHDTGEYSTLLGASWLLPNVMGASDATAFGSDDIGKPYYLDLIDKKTRIICLNTCEGEMSGESWTVSSGQVDWFRQRLYEVGSKDGWRIMVLGHYPLDFGGARDLGNVMYAYVKGLSSGSVDFCGHNKAVVIGNFHGHTHCFKVDRLNYMQYGSSGWYPTPFDAMRIATPSSNFYRNNDYTNAFHGIVFGDNVTYNKTAGTAEDTSFTVNVVDLDTESIHSFCYGAGPEYQEVSYHFEKEVVPEPEEPTITNQVPISLASGGGAVYNGTGYQNAKRIGSGGTESNNGTTFVTGFIPCVDGDVIRLGGEGISFNVYGCMLFTYGSNFSPLTSGGFDYSKVGQGENFGYDTADGNAVIKWSPPNAVKANCKYIRISATGDGANAIVTKNEEL